MGLNLPCVPQVATNHSLGSLLRGGQLVLSLNVQTLRGSRLSQALCFRCRIGGRADRAGMVVSYVAPVLSYIS